MSRSVNNFSKRVRTEYNQNAISKGLKIPAGLYRGFVVEHGDDRHMGRVKVQISKFYGTMRPDLQEESFSSDEFIGAIWCQFMTPLGGGGNGNSYGLWAAPPAVGTDVVVGFSGDSQIGIIMGILPNEQRMSNMAGPVATQTKEGTFAPAQDKPHTAETESEKPNEHPQAEALRTQGLDGDRIRGLSQSDPQRESPSRVTAWSTPTGHSVVMDDGTVEDGDSNLMRFRTASGNQILMDDTNGLVYIVTNSGLTWIEMNRNGDLDIYSKNSINVHTEGDYNLHVGGAFNLQANTINQKATGTHGIKLEAESGTVDIFAHSNLQIQSESNGNLRVSGTYSETAGAIHMNSDSSPALAASLTTPKNQVGNKTVTESIAGRVPEAEPWAGHLDVQTIDPTSTEGASTTTGAGTTSTYYDNNTTSATGDSGENTGAYELEPYDEQDNTSASGLVVWASGVDKRIDPRLYAMVEEIASKFGQTLTITSGYRSPAHNRRANGAKKSQHMLGKAVDIRGSGFTEDERNQLIALASAAGVIGIGVYNDKSLHFDIRESGRRAGWGSSFSYASTPSYAKATIDTHISGGYA